MTEALILFRAPRYLRAYELLEWLFAARTGLLVGAMLRRQDRVLICTVALVGDVCFLDKLAQPKTSSPKRVSTQRWNSPVTRCRVLPWTLLIAPATRQMLRRRRNLALSPTLPTELERSDALVSSRARADSCRPSVPGCLQGHVARNSSGLAAKAKRAGRWTHESYHRHNEHPSAQRRAPHAIAASHKTEITRTTSILGGGALARGDGITAPDRA